ncbi:TPA: hypothetical protein ACJIWP_003734 [Enterobacter cloacae]|nr:hypothetical protein [Enterobacter cloacae]
MTFTGQISKDIPDYELARSLGLASGGDINFTALANQLDCSRNFSQVGIIYSDGAVSQTFKTDCDAKRKLGKSCRHN